MRRFGRFVALVVGVGVGACSDEDGGPQAPSDVAATTAGETVGGVTTEDTASGTALGTEVTAATSADAAAVDDDSRAATIDAAEAETDPTETTEDVGPETAETAETPDTTPSETDDATPDPFDYNMFSQEVSIGYDMSGAEPTHCAIALAGTSVGEFLLSLTGATSVESEVAYCGEDSISCPNLFLHDVLGRDGGLYEVLGPLALKLGDLTETRVERAVVHAKSVDYYAVVLAGTWQGQLVGIAFVPDLPYCGVD